MSQWMNLDLSWLQGWKLVLTGHSLGAGAAALISMKIHDRYPGTDFMLTKIRSSSELDSNLTIKSGSDV